MIWQYVRCWGSICIYCAGDTFVLLANANYLEFWYLDLSTPQWKVAAGVCFHLHCYFVFIVSIRQLCSFDTFDLWCPYRGGGGSLLIPVCLGLFSPFYSCCCQQMTVWFTLRLELGDVRRDGLGIHPALLVSAQAVSGSVFSAPVFCLSLSCFRLFSPLLFL